MRALLAIIPAILLAGCAVDLSDRIESDWEQVQLSESQALEYRVYLPPQYHTEPTREFPLLVYFHGGGGDHRTWGAKGGLGERMIPKMEKGEFGPFIVLSPSVGRFDVITGEAERILFDEIIPSVREQYRTSERTVAFGHSMGGLSAMMLSLRHPEVFEAVAVASPYAYDVSPFQAEEEVERFEEKYPGGPFISRWNNSIGGKFETAEEFNAYSPFEQIRRLDRPVPFSLFLTTGTEDYMGLYPQNRMLHEELVRKGIQHEYLVQDGVGHTTIMEPSLYQWMNEQADRPATVGSGGGR